MNLLLTSRGIELESVREIFLNLTKDLEKEVVVVTTASVEYKEKNRNTIQLVKNLKDLEFKVKYLDLEFEDAELLKKAQIVIFSGGNPYYLLYHLKKRNADDVLRNRVDEKVLILGISAGAFMFIKDLSIVDLLTPEMNTPNLIDKSCIGLMKDDLVPHYDRFIREGQFKESQILDYEKESGRRVVRINENDFILVGKEKIIST